MASKKATLVRFVEAAEQVKRSVVWVHLVTVDFDDPREVRTAPRKVVRRGRKNIRMLTVAGMRKLQKLSAERPRRDRKDKS
jgi:hypothetical protein